MHFICTITYSNHAAIWALNSYVVLIVYVVFNLLKSIYTSVKWYKCFINCTFGVWGNAISIICVTTCCMVWLTIKFTLTLLSDILLWDGCRCTCVWIGVKVRLCVYVNMWLCVCVYMCVCSTVMDTQSCMFRQGRWVSLMCWHLYTCAAICAPPPPVPTVPPGTRRVSRSTLDEHISLSCPLQRGGEGDRQAEVKIILQKR